MYKEEHVLNLLFWIEQLTVLHSVAKRMKVSLLGLQKGLWLLFFLGFAAVFTAVSYLFFYPYMFYLMFVSIVLCLVGVVGFFFLRSKEGSEHVRLYHEEFNTRTSWLQRAFNHALILRLIPTLSKDQVNQFIAEQLPNEQWRDSWGMLRHTIDFKGFSAWLAARKGSQSTDATEKQTEDIKLVEEVCRDVARYIQHLLEKRKVSNRSSGQSFTVHRHTSYEAILSYVKRMVGVEGMDESVQEKFHKKFDGVKRINIIQKSLFKLLVGRYVDGLSYGFGRDVIIGFFSWLAAAILGSVMIWLLCQVIPVQLFAVVLFAPQTLALVTIAWVGGSAVLGAFIFLFTQAPQLLRKFRLRYFLGMGLGDEEQKAFDHIHQNKDTTWDKVVGVLSAAGNQMKKSAKTIWKNGYKVLHALFLNVLSCDYAEPGFLSFLQADINAAMRTMKEQVDAMFPMKEEEAPIDHSDLPVAKVLSTLPPPTQSVISTDKGDKKIAKFFYEWFKNDDSHKGDVRDFSHEDKPFTVEIAYEPRVFPRGYKVVEIIRKKSTKWHKMFNEDSRKRYVGVPAYIFRRVKDGKVGFDGLKSRMVFKEHLKPESIEVDVSALGRSSTSSSADTQPLSPPLSPRQMV